MAERMVGSWLSGTIFIELHTVASTSLVSALISMLFLLWMKHMMEAAW